jgi:hypothetical protein
LTTDRSSNRSSPSISSGPLPEPGEGADPAHAGHDRGRYGRQHRGGWPA